MTGRAVLPCTVHTHSCSSERPAHQVVHAGAGGHNLGNGGGQQRDDGDDQDKQAKGAAHKLCGQKAPRLMLL